MWDGRSKGRRDKHAKVRRGAARGRERRSWTGWAPRRRLPVQGRLQTPRRRLPTTKAEKTLTRPYRISGNQACAGLAADSRWRCRPRRSAGRGMAHLTAFLALLGIGHHGRVRAVRHGVWRQAAAAVLRPVLREFEYAARDDRHRGGIQQAAAAVPRGQERIRTTTGGRTATRSPAACWRSPACAWRTGRKNWPAGCGAPPPHTVHPPAVPGCTRPATATGFTITHDAQ